MGSCQIQMNDLQKAFINLECPESFNDAEKLLLYKLLLKNPSEEEFQNIVNQIKAGELYNTLSPGDSENSGYQVETPSVSPPEDFTGREHVFDAINLFIKNKDCGYFTIVGDPGEGKTAIIAEYVRRTGCVSYFNIAARGINREDKCLEKLCDSIELKFDIRIQDIPKGFNDGEYFVSILKAASSKLKENEKIIIAVDAIDEMDLSDHPLGANILYLPDTPPRGVFFLFSTRNVDHIFPATDKHGSYKLSSNKEEYERDTLQYLSDSIKQQEISDWLDLQKIDENIFIERMVKNSQGNFMYLSCILNGIKDGIFDDFSFDLLPVSLSKYYERQWDLMGMNSSAIDREKVHIIYLLAVCHAPLSVELIARFLHLQQSDAFAIIRELTPFLRQTQHNGTIYYCYHHKSFLDFINQKRIIRITGVDLCDVHKRLADALWELIGEEENLIDSLQGIPGDTGFIHFGASSKAFRNFGAE